MKFDLTKVEFSKYDKKRGIKIPEKPTVDLAYLIGIHIGDGSINFYKNRWVYSVRGHKIDDRKHYKEVIKPLFKKVYNIDFNLREWKDVFGFQFSSKAILSFENSLGLPLGPKEGIVIPEIFINKKLMPFVIRGIFDTDGCVYLEKKKKGLYPRLELGSASKDLILQIRSYLNENKISSCYYIAKRKKKNWKPLHKIIVRGFKNVNRWMNLIGTDHPKHIYKIRKVNVPGRI